MLHRQNTQQRAMQRTSVTGKRFRAYRPRSRVAYVRIAFLLVFLSAFVLLKPSFRLFQPHQVVIHGGVPIDDEASFANDGAHDHDNSPVRVPLPKAPHLESTDHSHLQSSRASRIASLRDRRGRHSIFHDQNVIMHDSHQSSNHLDHPILGGEDAQTLKPSLHHEADDLQQPPSHRFAESDPEQQLPTDVLRNMDAQKETLRADEVLGGAHPHLKTGHTLDGDAQQHGAQDNEAQAADNLVGDAASKTTVTQDARIHDGNADGVNHEDSNDGESSADDASAGDANADAAKANDANADGANADGANDDGTNDDSTNDDDANDDGTNDDSTNDDGANDDSTNDDGTNDGDAEANDADAKDANADDANAGDANAGDANAGDANAGDANAGDANAGDANADDANADDADADDADADDADADDADARDADAKDDDAKDVNADDANTDDNNADDANADDSNADDANLGDSNGDDANASDANAGDAQAGDAQAGDAQAGETNAAKADDANVDDANADDANANDGNANDSDAENADAVDAKADGFNADSATANDANADDANTDNPDGNGTIADHATDSNTNADRRTASDVTATIANAEVTNADDASADNARANDEHGTGGRSENAALGDRNASEHQIDNRREDEQQARDAHVLDDQIRNRREEAFDARIRQGNGALDNHGEEGDAQAGGVGRNENFGQNEAGDGRERDEKTYDENNDDFHTRDPQGDQKNSILSPLDASINMRQSNTVFAQPQQIHVAEKSAPLSVSSTNVAPQNVEQQYSASKPVQRSTPLLSGDPQHQQFGELRPVQRIAPVQNAAPQNVQKQYYHGNELQPAQRTGHASSISPIQEQYMEPQPHEPTVPQGEMSVAAQGPQKGLVESQSALGTSHISVDGAQNLRPQVAPLPGQPSVGLQDNKYEEPHVKENLNISDSPERNVDERDDPVIMDRPPLRASINQKEPHVPRQSLPQQYPPPQGPQQSMLVQKNVNVQRSGEGLQHSNISKDEQSYSLDTRLAQRPSEHNGDMIDHMKRVPERNSNPLYRSFSSSVTNFGSADMKSTLTHAGEFKV